MLLYCTAFDLLATYEHEQMKSHPLWCFAALKHCHPERSEGSRPSGALHVFMFILCTLHLTACSSGVPSVAWCRSSAASFVVSPCAYYITDSEIVTGDYI